LRRLNKQTRFKQLLAQKICEGGLFILSSHRLPPTFQELMIKAQFDQCNFTWKCIATSGHKTHTPLHSKKPQQAQDIMPCGDSMPQHVMPELPWSCDGTQAVQEQHDRKNTMVF
jgi:hypothetical protein